MPNWQKHFQTVATPQSEPIPNEPVPQVPNSAGGFSWEVDKWKRLNRFLVLGSEGGSYYAGESKLTKENAQSVLDCIKEDGPRAVSIIAEVSDQGRAIKNDYGIYCLAMACKLGNDETRAAAHAAVSTVCRIPTHLMMFAEFLKGFGGWGRATKRAISEWYLKRQPKNLAFLLTKFGARGGKGQRWSHRDLLLKSHTKPQDMETQYVFEYIVKGTLNEEFAKSHPAGQYLQAVDLIRKRNKDDSWAIDNTEMLGLVSQHSMPEEVIPTDRRGEDVYRLMVNNYGMTALLRNLSNMSHAGVLVPHEFEVVNMVCNRLTDEAALKRGRVHPLSILVAMEAYRKGVQLRPPKGGNRARTWKPVPDVLDALDQAFYKAFQTVEPTGKTRMLAIDVSGSMGWESSMIANTAITARQGAAAMAMVTYKVEQRVLPVAFSNSIVPVDISRASTLREVVDRFARIPMGGTDCAAPMMYAMENKIPGIDSFEIYTDSETWDDSRHGGYGWNRYGGMHPAQALDQYRNKYNPEAKLIIVGMVANKFTCARPNDPGMLDVVGFDTSAPSVMSQFVAGKL